MGLMGRGVEERMLVVLCLSESETFASARKRFADEEPVPASLARSCPRSFDFVRVAHFAQDDKGGRELSGMTKEGRALRMTKEARALNPIVSLDRAVAVARS
jgi:hypothetical protein